MLICVDICDPAARQQLGLGIDLRGTPLVKVRIVAYESFLVRCMLDVLAWKRKHTMKSDMTENTRLTTTRTVPAFLLGHDIVPDQTQRCQQR